MDGDKQAPRFLRRFCLWKGTGRGTGNAEFPKFGVPEPDHLIACLIPNHFDAGENDCVVCFVSAGHNGLHGIISVNTVNNSNELRLLEIIRY